MVFCKKCGLTYNAQPPNREGAKRYYRHSYANDCSQRKYIPASLLENAVLMELVNTFGDREKIEKAIKRGNPDTEKVEELRQEKKRHKKKIDEIKKKKNNIVGAISEDIITKEEAKAKMQELREKNQALNNRVQTINNKIAEMPDPERIKRASEWSSRIIGDATKEPKLIFERDYEWKRNLIEHAFGGKDAKGDRLGVYIEETGDKNQPWEIEIRGILEKTAKHLPLNDLDIAEALNIDPYYQENTKQKIDSFREELESVTNFSNH